MSDISLVDGSECRVSSVLGRNTRELGKQHLFDGSPETCWNSDQGTPQWVAIRWPSPVQVNTIVTQFQVSVKVIHYKASHTISWWSVAVVSDLMGLINYSKTCQTIHLISQSSVLAFLLIERNNKNRKKACFRFSFR